MVRLGPYAIRLSDVKCLLSMVVFLGVGGIGGVLYGSTTANDGDFVQTSPIESGKCEGGNIVTTHSGSKYLLGAKNPSPDTKAAEDIQIPREAKRRATITLPKLGKKKDSSKPPQHGVKRSTSKPRPTFSLFDMFGMGSRRRKKAGSTTCDTVPTLTRWSANADGTITGVVSGSPHLKDGDIVITSKISSGEPAAKTKASTETGSTDYLE